MEVSVGDIAMPGDTVRDEGETDNIILGPGLRRDGRTMIVCKTGILKKRSKPIVYYVDCYQKRYFFFVFPKGNKQNIIKKNNNFFILLYSTNYYCF